MKWWNPTAPYATKREPALSAVLLPVAVACGASPGSAAQEEERQTARGASGVVTPPQATRGGTVSSATTLTGGAAAAGEPSARQGGFAPEDASATPPDPCGEIDTDGDGVRDRCDNCPDVVNPDQSSTRAEGLGDACSCGNPVVRCTEGRAGPFPCERVDLLSSLTPAELGSRTGNDVWGYVQESTGREIAVAGVDDGTVFVDVTSPVCPEVLGKLASGTASTITRDVKVLGDYALVVAEARRHGMQVFDLRTLLEGAPATLQPVATYEGNRAQPVDSAHNIAVAPGRPYAYIVAARSCGRGLHIADMRNPSAPAFAGCYSERTAIHDAQCVVYEGPDTEHLGKDLCLTLNGSTTFSIVDLTDKGAPARLSRAEYEGRYSHQGWLTEDQRYFLVGDELDELTYGGGTKTFVFDVSDLDAPKWIGTYESPSPAVDHNLYVRGGYAFASNYESGLRILSLAGVAEGRLEEVGYFDTVPGSESPQFNGAWSTYVGFPSGNLVLNGLDGLFVLRFDERLLAP